MINAPEEVRSTSGREVEPPLRKAAAVAVLDNPFAGVFEPDLSALVAASERVGEEICRVAVKMLAPGKPESYGKAAVIGTNGEQEHGVAMLTTVFGNVMREAAGGRRRQGLDLVAHQTGGARCYDRRAARAQGRALCALPHDGMTLTLHDCPLPDEIAIICVYASRGRPHHRVRGLAAGAIKGIDGLN